MNQIEQAKETLRKAGYFVGSWSVKDLMDKYNCTEEQAQEVLEEASGNDATMEQMWFAIDFHAEELGLTEIETE